ncbi:MAG: hypothetical protein Q9162_006789 [Coniocarpon cinnabarinum]
MAPLLSPKTPNHLPNRPPGGSASPNYFGLQVDPASTTVKSTGSGVAQTPWTTDNSHFFSAAATSPQKIVGTNPDYEAFLKQSEENRANLTRNNSIPPLHNPVSLPIPPSSFKSARKQQTSSPGIPPSTSAPPPCPRIEAEDDITQHSRSPKRLLSSEPELLFNSPRRQSPADFNDKASSRSLGSPTRRQGENLGRLSLPPRATPPVVKDQTHHRSSTIASPSEADAPAFITPQHAVNLMNENGDQALLLDLRVSTQYAEAHLKGALNLCIPTTLLKRPSYNVSRLADTFKDDAKKAKFSSWQSCNILIMYDNSSSQLKEASNCVNILKKFSSEGWKGQSFVVRGGFQEAAQKCPHDVEDSASGGISSVSAKLAIRSENADLPPVMGGCPMPATKTAANPFFGNIRQNMDLMDGVGQMPVHCPSGLNKRDIEELPLWLRKAVNEHDHGKTVSNKFLRIEKREQKRMQQALSGDNSMVTSPSIGPVEQVEIAGIEKGTKNRYNNIFPFEHSRVRLKGVPQNACDYVNANFIQTSLSHKKYIATQGPIPATFGDFWNMVWQRDVKVIVMLTAESEGGQIKAHNYWSEKRYGPVKINFHSENRASLDGNRLKNPAEKKHAQRRSSHLGLPGSSTDDTDSRHEEQPAVIVRKFTITHDNHPFERMREVTHLQYTSWPDFGTPAHPVHLLRLVEQCDGVIHTTSTGPSDGPEPPSARPVLVHCSAGCGRTGTFCTVDTVVDILKRQRRHRNRPRQPTPMDLDSDERGNGMDAPSINPKPQNVDGEWLNQDNTDLVERVVDEFRLQRLSMVQSLRQFVLCYETVLEWIAQLGIPKTA